jgi:hypothetical protein
MRRPREIGLEDHGLAVRPAHDAGQQVVDHVRDMGFSNQRQSAAVVLLAHGDRDDQLGAQLGPSDPPRR